MKNLIKKTLRILIPSSFRRFIQYNKKFFSNKYVVESYSQEGEDIILSRFFHNKQGEKGFYVDVGAHHPFRFSNTYLFYKRSWDGINIDATPGSMDLFNKFRTRDINIECAISDQERIMKFYIFEEGALNTFSKELAEGYIKDGAILLKEESIKQHRLSQILDSYLEPEAKIDFMSIDAEECELQVLKSNDWTKYRPDIILIESLGFEMDKANSSEIYNYLIKLGYKIAAKTYNTLFFTNR